MQTQAAKSPSLTLWGIGVPVMMLSTGGFAALMAWMPAPAGALRNTLPVSAVEHEEPGAATARGKPRCGECGVIESIRQAEAHGEAISLVAAGGSVAENRAPVKSASREITVRLEDGSSRVIVDTNPGRLRIGERVKVID